METKIYRWKSMKNQIIEIEVNGIYGIYHKLKGLLFYFVLVENI
jgi:hypothetical protein